VAAAPLQLPTYSSYVTTPPFHIHRLISVLLKDINNLERSCPSRNRFTSKILNTIYFSSPRLGTCYTCQAPTSRNDTCCNEMVKEPSLIRTCRSYHASFLGRGIDMFLNLSEETRTLMGFPFLTLNEGINREVLLSYAQYFAQDAEGGGGPILGITNVALLAIARVFVLTSFPHTPWDAAHIEQFFGVSSSILPANISLLPSSLPAAQRFRHEMHRFNIQFHHRPIDYANPPCPYIPSYDFPIELPTRRVSEDEARSTFPSTDDPPPYSVTASPQQSRIIVQSNEPATSSLSLSSGRPIMITIIIPATGELPEDVRGILRTITESPSLRSTFNHE
jgi:hypothetical protein